MCYVLLVCQSERTGAAWGLWGFGSFGWSPSQRGVTRMTGHLDLPHLYCPGEIFVLHPLSSPRATLCTQAWAEALVDVTPVSTQLIFQANTQWGRSIWTLTRGSTAIPPHPYPPSVSSVQTSRASFSWVTGHLKWWHSCGMVWAITSGCCDFQVLDI